MSREIFRNIEEAIAREVRRISFHHKRTESRTVLQDTFNPFTGEVISAPIEPDFYDSSANVNFIQYPNFTIKLVKTLEDLTSNRVTPPYGKQILTAVKTSPKAFEIVLQGLGSITVSGNTLITSAFQLRKVQSGHLIRLLKGNNIGTYIVDSVVLNNDGNHTITVKNDLIINLPALFFQSVPREVYFNTPVDLSTVKIGDNLVDSSNTIFPITSIDLNKNMLVIGGTTSPNLTIGAKIIRNGNVFQNIDSILFTYSVLDPTKPVSSSFSCESTSQVVGLSPKIPIDAYYLVRVDSKERQTHIDVLNRIWEEFNPPRTGLPVVVRSALSFEQPLTLDVTTGGSNTITVKDNSGFNINDPVVIINKFVPTKNNNHGFSGEIVTKVVSKLPNNQLVLSQVIPDSFTVDSETLVVSNAEIQILLFHFLDHNTKDVDAAQYWVHEFTFLIQLWIDRLESSSDYSGVVQQIFTPIEDLQGNIIINDDP
jgi:hypothetical protein